MRSSRSYVLCSHVTPALILCMQLRSIPTDKESRGEFRAAWTRIVEVHFSDDACYPVSINERSDSTSSLNPCLSVGKASMLHISYFILTYWWQPLGFAECSDRVQLCALVAKVCRRKVIFKDDCELVNEYFMTVRNESSILMDKAWPSPRQPCVPLNDSGIIWAKQTNSYHPQDAECGSYDHQAMSLR